MMMVVGCIRFFISSLPRRRSSAAIRTTDVVPSPTSLSCCCARSTKILPAGSSTSRRDRIVAPSFVTVTSCTYCQIFKPYRALEGEDKSYANIVHHHLVETAGAKGALDDIRDRLRSQNCSQLRSARCLAVIRPIMTPNIPF